MPLPPEATRLPDPGHLVTIPTTQPQPRRLPTSSPHGPGRLPDPLRHQPHPPDMPSRISPGPAQPTLPLTDVPSRRRSTPMTRHTKSRRLPTPNLACPTNRHEPLQLGSDFPRHSKSGRQTGPSLHLTDFPPRAGPADNPSQALPSRLHSPSRATADESSPSAPPPTSHPESAPAHDFPSPVTPTPSADPPFLTDPVRLPDPRPP
jgi:hypothetical protein